MAMTSTGEKIRDLQISLYYDSDSRVRILSFMVFVIFKIHFGFISDWD